MMYRNGHILVKFLIFNHRIKNMIRRVVLGEMTLEEFYTFAESHHKLNLKPHKKDKVSLVMTGVDFKKIENDKKPFIVEPLFKEGEFILISGGPKAGKSWFAIDLSLLIALGGSIGKRLSSSKPHKILYVDSEMDASTVGWRKNIIETLYDKKKDTENNFGYLPIKQYLNQIDLSEKDDQQWVENQINSHDAKIILFDNLKGFIQDGRVKYEEKWAPFSRWIGTLIGPEKRKTVLLVHHEDVSGEVRGTKTMLEDVHLVISLNNPTMNTIEETGLKTISEIHLKYSRYLFGKPLYPFSIEYITEKDEETGEIIQFDRVVNVDLKNNDKPLESKEVRSQHELTDDRQIEISQLELTTVNQKEIARKIYDAVRVAGKEGIELRMLMNQKGFTKKMRSNVKIILKKFCVKGLMRTNGTGRYFFEEVCTAPLPIGGPGPEATSA